MRGVNATPIAIEGYGVLRELGRGAMGVVLLARDEVLDREVAIKVIGGADDDPDAVARFLWEARATARLSHPNVITVYRAGMSPTGPYLVMELLRGRALDAALATGGALASARLFKVAIEASRGLAAAHARGIVHRDIKPSNLFECDDGAVKVLDFGVAKLLGARRPAGGADLAASDASALAATLSPGDGASVHATQVTGTPRYMSPEVWREEGADRASDVWSLGATLYALATGDPPFSGRSVLEVAHHIMSEAAAEPVRARRPDLPASLGEVIDRALAKDRARRYANAAEMLAALERASRASRDRGAFEGAPFPGLRAMTAEDRDRFFGREEDVARVVERLRAEALVVLVGPSGAGKSSLAGAGVVPTVLDGALGSPSSWRVLRVLPGRSPLRALASAVAALGDEGADAVAKDLADTPGALARRLRARVVARGEGVLLWFDQLEELVTVADREERDATSAALARLVELGPEGVRVLATARSDLFDRLGALGDAGVLLGRATEIVRPLSGDQLRAAIVEPVRAAGATFEDPRAVDAILAEAGDAQGALPLIAFAMRAWWDRRDPAANTLTAAGWAAVGGVHGALGAHAEAVFAGLSLADQGVVGPTLVRLVASDGTRRYATRAELAAGAGDAAGVRRVVEAFARARLLLVDGDGDDAQVTLAHEAMARAWPRLAAWCEDGRDDLRLLERLTAAATTWDAAGRPEGLVWRGAPLGELESWREVYDDRLVGAARAFADASRRARATTRGRWIFAAASLAALVVALGVTVAVRVARSRASARREAAARVRAESAARLDAEATALSMAHALRESDPGAALAWLAHAVALRGRASAAVGAAAAALEARGVPTRFDCTAAPAMLPDGSRFACADGSRIFVVDLTDGRVRRVEAPARVRQVALAARSSRVAWLDGEGDLFVQEGSARIRPLREPPRGRPWLALDPEGERLVVFERATGRLSVFGVEDGALKSRVEGAAPADERDTAVIEAREGEFAVVTRSALQPERRVYRRFLYEAHDPAGAGPSPDGEPEPTEARDGRPGGRGDARWPGRLGLPDAAVVVAHVDSRDGRAVVIDDRDRVFVYAVPLAWRLDASRWLPEDSVAPGRAPDGVAGVRVVALSGARAGVMAVGRGAFVVDLSRRAVTYSLAADPVAVDARGGHGLMAFADGHGERIDLARGASAGRGPLLDTGAPVAVAISADGSRVLAVGSSGAAVLRDVTRAGWPTVGYRWFGELSGATALAVTARSVAIAGRRFGVASSALGETTTLAEAPPDYYARRVTTARFVTERDLVLQDDGCGAWWARCAELRCDIERAAREGGGCAVAAAGRDGLVAVTRAGDVVAVHRDVGEFGAVFGWATGAFEGAAVDVSADAVVVAGGVKRPYVARLPLPPTSAEGFARWVDARVNMRVERGVARVIEPPERLP